MKYDPEIHQRRSVRLRNYDYSQAGLYFITICTHNRMCLFGRIINEKMVLNNAGKAANQCWHDIPEHYQNIQLHEFVTMPNHIHGIVGMENISEKRVPLGNVVRGFKIGVTKWFRQNLQYPVSKPVWQRNYWEHVIRNEKEHAHLAEYIINNPAKWDDDKLNDG